MQRRLAGGHSHRGPGPHRTTVSGSVDPIARLQSIFESGFIYSKRLVAHRSCVNAVTFSHGEGRWLASAGDDLRVLLWDFHQENVQVPSCSLTGHRSNIFCLDFSAQNQFLYSGSTDESILKYDVTTATSSANTVPVQTFTTHEDNVRGISCHPEQEDIFLSAGEDGLIALHDARIPGGRAGVLWNSCEATDVRFHPRAEKLFFTTDTHGNACLRDVRMAFGDGESTRGLTPEPGGKGTVLKYVTAITRRSVSYMVQPEAASLAVDRDGTKFAVNFLHHLPTIYSTSDPLPLAVCNGKKLPDGRPVPEGERTYRNTCTMKHGSFGGPGDTYYTTGSDDFRAYVWKIPDVAALQARRRVLSKDEFAEEPPSTIACAERTADDKRYIPVEINTPLFRLQGHDSIVNSALIHPHLPEIATCGVEQHITIHSPTPSAPNMEFSRTREDVRELPADSPLATRRFLYAIIAGHNVHGTVDERENLDDDERNTIDFFDGVIREHDDVSVFTTARRLNEDGMTTRRRTGFDEEMEIETEE